MYIVSSVTKISKAAFEHCNILEKVYYNGTAEDWSEMSIGADNSHFTSATRYYYSEEQPTEAGSFWHYVDGEVVEW